MSSISLAESCMCIDAMKVAVSGLAVHILLIAQLPLINQHVP